VSVEHSADLQPTKEREEDVHREDLRDSTLTIISKLMLGEVAIINAKRVYYT
jgi:hypothetical protein